MRHAGVGGARGRRRRRPPACTRSSAPIGDSSSGASASPEQLHRGVALPTVAQHPRHDPCRAKASRLPASSPPCPPRRRRRRRRAATSPARPRSSAGNDVGTTGRRPSTPARYTSSCRTRPLVVTGSSSRGPRGRAGRPMLALGDGKSARSTSRGNSEEARVGTTAEDLERAVRGYMDACTAGDAEAIAAFLTADARHYFPPDMYDGPWVGARTIGAAVGGRGARAALVVDRRRDRCRRAAPDRGLRVDPPQGRRRGDPARRGVLRLRRRRARSARSAPTTPRPRPRTSPASSSGASTTPDAATRTPADAASRSVERNGSRVGGRCREFARHECAREGPGRHRRAREHRHRPARQARAAQRIDVAYMVGVVESEGLARARRRGITASAEGVDWLLRQDPLPDIVFEATSAAAHRANAPRYAEAGIRAVDLTPAAPRADGLPAGQPRGAPRRPQRLHDHLRRAGDDPDRARGLAVTPVPYAEIVASIASRSRGPRHAREHRRVHPHHRAGRRARSAAPTGARRSSSSTRSSRR